MKILIIGATGFIGSNLFSFLEKQYEVCGTSRTVMNSKKYKRLDLLSLVNQENLSVDFDVIIHCASILATTGNNNNINLLYDNLKITESLVSIVKNNKPCLVINFSSIGVYPNVSANYNELSLIKPSENYEGLYGLSKFCSEEILSFFFKNTKTRIVNFRLGQTIGDGMRGDRTYSLMKKELKETNCITVFGNGERVSSFLNIEYLLNKVYKTLNNITLEGTFNLSQKNMTYLELANGLIAEYGDSNSKIELLAKGVKSKIYIDSSKLEKELSK